MRNIANEMAVSTVHERESVDVGDPRVNNDRGALGIGAG